MKELRLLKVLLGSSVASLEELALEAGCSVEEAVEELRKLEASGLVTLSGGSARLLDKVMGAVEALRAGARLSEVAPKLSWRDFEGLCSKAFEANGYATSTALRFKWADRRYEVDVAAWRKPLLIALDCKSWSLRAGKAPQLRRAVERHLERVEALAKALPSLRGRLKLPGGLEVLVTPCIVTLLEEALRIHGGVPIVPISKLNAFIQEVHAYVDSLTTFRAAL